MKITVAVVNYNVAPLLERCLVTVESALGEMGGGQAIVVENASSDDSAARVRQNFPAVRLVENAENVGFGAACNQVLWAAESDAVLFLNPDAELREGALPALAEALERRPAAALCGPRLVFPDDRPQPSRRRFPTLPALLLESTPFEWRGPRWPALAAYYRDDARSGATREDWLSGGCLLGRTTALCSVGGFDPAFFMYFEEVDVCRRLVGRGWETWYVPEAVVAHHHSRSADQDLLAKDRRYYRSKYRYAARYFGRTTARVVRLASAAQFAAELGIQRRRGESALVERYSALLRWHLSSDK